MPFNAQSAPLASDGPGNGFWSELTGSFPGVFQGLNRVAADLIPRWTARELQLQTTDQTKKPTFNPAKATRSNLAPGTFSVRNDPTTGKTVLNLFGETFTLDTSTAVAIMVVGGAFGLFAIAKIFRG